MIEWINLSVPSMSFASRIEYDPPDEGGKPKARTLQRTEQNGQRHAIRVSNNGPSSSTPSGPTS